MPTDPTIADLIADLGDRPYTPPTDTRDALITLARVVAAQADRLDVLEAVVADRAKARPGNLSPRALAVIRERSKGPGSAAGMYADLIALLDHVDSLA